MTAEFTEMMHVAFCDIMHERDFRIKKSTAV